MLKVQKLLKKNFKFLRLYTTENPIKTPENVKPNQEEEEKKEKDEKSKSIKKETPKVENVEKKEEKTESKKEGKEEDETEKPWSPFVNEKEPLPWAKDIPKSELDDGAGEHSEDSRRMWKNTSKFLRYFVSTILAFVLFGYFNNLYKESQGIYDPDRKYIIEAQKKRLAQSMEASEKKAVLEKKKLEQNLYKDEIAKLLAKQELEKEIENKKL